MSEKIKLSDFKIIFDVRSARKEEISDEIYFSSAYKKYLSNSSIGTINPAQGGSAYKYKHPERLDTQSLTLGGRIHEQILQPGEFTIAPKCGRPSAKLGNMMDEFKKLRKKGMGLRESLIEASKKANYYASSIETKLDKGLRTFLGTSESRKNESIEKAKNCIKYYLLTKDYPNDIAILSDNDWDTVHDCVSNVESDRGIQNLLHPRDEWGDPIEAYNEDALFIDITVTYKGKCVTLPFKMKADNWTIDTENKILTLNDLKTTSHNLDYWMSKKYNGSFYQYHYYRQFAIYLTILKYYCMLNYGVNRNWTFKGNVLVVSTVTKETRVFPINATHIKEGEAEYERLLKMIAYYEMFGYKEEQDFE